MDPVDGQCYVESRCAALDPEEYGAALVEGRKAGNVAGSVSAL